MKQNFTQIHNELLRSKRIDSYSKLIFCLIASCNPSFPSYEILMEWSGLSRERVWKSLKVLENHNLIKRFKCGRLIKYKIYTSSPDELIKGEPVRYTNSISSPDELEPVRQTNSKNTKEKEQRKRENSDLKSDKNSQKSEAVSSIMVKALSLAGSDLDPFDEIPF